MTLDYQKRIFLPFSLLLACSLVAFSTLAQSNEAITPKGSSIVDDSTRNVYGPHTSKWTTEQEWFDNRPNYRALDTTVRNYHRWTYVQQFDYTFQDLGVMGTALNSIYPVMPSQIGASSGFHAYEQYFATQEPHYYDTKSPITKMRIIWGGGGRAMSDIKFSRNINPRWNVGFSYRPILIEKQIQSKGKSDKQTTSNYYDFFTTYATKDNRYALLFNFRRIRHKVIENGGVKVSENDPFSAMFDPNTAPNLTTAKTEEWRRAFHLSHRYQLDEALQLYHIADFNDQSNSFSDTQAPTTFYDYSKPGLKTADDMASFNSMQQEVGVKGNASKFFYSAYYRFRSYHYFLKDTVGTSSNLSADISGTENYLGGRISLKLDSITDFSGSAEYLLGGYYRLDGKINSPWLDATFKSSRSKPGYLPMIYSGSHDYWRQVMEGVNSTEISGFLKVNTGGVQLQAGGTFTLFNNAIYFRQVTPSDPDNTQTVLPFQSSGIQSTFSPELRASLKFLRHVYFRPRIIYTSFLRNDDNMLKIPQMFMNLQLTYENLLFTNHLQLQVGIESHWHSSYQALAYDMPIQQFYVQDSYVNQSFALVDFFLNAKMRRGRFFIKYHNIVQLVTKSGYVPTQGYPGTRNLIDFGFEFLLFD